MYAAIALILVVVFASAAFVIPLYYPAVQERIIGWLQVLVLGAGNRTVVDAGDKRRHELAMCLRVWFFVGALFFALLGFRDGTVIRNHPAAIGSVLGYGVLAMGGSGVVMLSVIAYAWFLPAVKLYTAMVRCGFRELWFTGFDSPSDELRRGILERLRNSSSVPILDVTGYELIGRGPGRDGGLLYDVLASEPRIPVSVLLFRPHSSEIDPDNVHATVFRTIVSDMQISEATYMKRLRLTLRALKALNAQRPPETRIRVRFYSERPTLRAMIFQDSMIVSPWIARDDTTLTLFEVAQSSSVPTFYENFRQNFSRLWRNSASRIDPPPARNRPATKRPAVPVTGSSRHIAINLTER